MDARALTAVATARKSARDFRMRCRVLIEKLTGHADEGGVIYRYFVRPGSRSRPWIWFDRDEAPPFEGNKALLEIERVKGGWRVLGSTPE